MGLFSSKKKHFVDTQIARVIDDTLVPDVMITALMEKTFQNKELVSAIQDQALNGSFRRFEKMYRYAKNGDYAYGLPNARVLSSADGYALAEAAIEAEIIGDVTGIEYMHFRPLNNIHAGWQHLTQYMAYDPNTNIIGLTSSTIGEDVYLEKMVAVHSSAAGREPEQSSIGTWEASPSAGPTPVKPAWDSQAALRKLDTTLDVRIGTGETESVEIHYIWATVDGSGNETIHRDSLIVNLESYDTDREYYQAKYTYVESGITKTGYWTYDPVTGANADLNNVFQTPSFVDPGTYFPFAVFRSEGANRATDVLSDTDEYKTTTKLLDYLDIDFREMADAMHEDANINDVDQAVLMMGVPITSEHPVEIDYLFRYFSDIYEKLPGLAQSPVNYSQLPNLDSKFGLSGAPDTSYAIEITDADFNMTLSLDTVTRKYKSGSIGAVGTVQNVLELTETTSVVFDEELTDATAPRPVRVFRKQITAGVYQEVRVINPSIRFRIYAELGAEGGASDERLLVPLDYSITRNMQALDTESLYYRSLHFVFNSHVVQEIKWYQTGAFRALLTIAAVVITIITYGATWKASLAAAAAGGTTAVVLAALKIVLTYVLESIVFQFVFTQVVEQLGVENAYWLAVALAAVGGFKAYKAGEIVANSTAANMIAVSNGLVSGAKNTLSRLFSEYQADVQAFNLMVEESYEELEEAKKLLDSGIDLNPFAFIGQEPIIIFGETPDAYYERATHTGNPGARSLNLIQNFISDSLRLPSIEESLGDPT